MRPELPTVEGNALTRLNMDGQVHAEGFLGEKNCFLTREACVTQIINLPRNLFNVNVNTLSDPDSTTLVIQIGLFCSDTDL